MRRPCSCTRQQYACSKPCLQAAQQGTHTPTRCKNNDHAAYQSASPKLPPPTAHHCHPLSPPSPPTHPPTFISAGTLIFSTTAAALAPGISLPLSWAAVCSSAGAASPALGLPARRGKTTRLALSAFRRLAFSCGRGRGREGATAPRGVEVRQDEYIPQTVLQMGIAFWRQRIQAYATPPHNQRCGAAAAALHVTDLQGLQAAVAAAVVHGDADGGRQLGGDASLLQAGSKARHRQKQR